MIYDVFFDLDHTLWDFEKNSALAFEGILAKHNISINLDEFLLHYIPLNRLYWEKYRNEEITQAELRYRRLKEAFDLLCYEIDDEKINLLSDEYIEYLPKYNHLFDGTLEILDYLRAKYRLHIITNGFHEIQNHKLTNSNIQHYFITVTNSETCGAKKPNPIIFEHALKVAGAQKENSIMIGDCIDADVRGALNCGIDAILFSEAPVQIEENVKQIRTLHDLKKYL
ncbi:MAG TPA: YjjG family noncanonical pyrimidine nucleotidase [Flavobacterium sp.]|jgi:putative hydrolase of the HAD superfamily